VEGYVLTMANVKKSPPSSIFIFFSVPIIPRHGPHHSEYISTTKKHNKQKCNFYKQEFWNFCSNVSDYFLWISTQWKKRSGMSMDEMEKSVSTLS